MREAPFWLDLCAGLGGFSQAARDRGWHVLTADINRAFKPSFVVDLEDPVQVMRLASEIERYARPTVISASPVCIEFTKAGLPATWVANRLKPARPDTKLTLGCLDLIWRLKPTWWVVENVPMARKYLTPILGPVYGKVNGHVFWGRLPCLLPDTRLLGKEKMSPSPDRAALRSKIPYEIGEAICLGAERNL